MFGSTSDRLPIKPTKTVGSENPQEEGIIPMKDEKEKNEVQQRYQQELSKYKKQVEKNDREKKKVA